MLEEMECIWQFVTAEVMPCQMASHMSWKASDAKTMIISEYQHYAYSSSMLNHVLHQFLVAQSKSVTYINAKLHTSYIQRQNM